MGSLKKEPRSTLSLLFALLQEVRKVLMDLEPVLSNRNCSLVWGVNSPKQTPMDVGAGGDEAVLSVSVIGHGLPGHRVLNHIHVFVSIPRDSDFQVETGSQFVTGGK